MSFVKKSWTKNNSRVWVHRKFWTTFCYCDYYFVSCCTWFLSSRFFLRLWVWVWIVIHLLHFLDFIGIGCCRVSNSTQTHLQCFSRPIPINSKSKKRNWHWHIARCGCRLFRCSRQTISTPTPLFNNPTLKYLNHQKDLFSPC